ncbi:hypothetical protein ACOMHN_018020 [Nucella lapillus]
MDSTTPTKSRDIAEDLRKAVEAAKSGMSLGAASKNFGVPKTTIADSVSGKRGMTAKRGRKQDIPEDIKGGGDKGAGGQQKRVSSHKEEVFGASGMAGKNMKTRFKNGTPGAGILAGSS